MNLMILYLCLDQSFATWRWNSSRDENTKDWDGRRAFYFAASGGSDKALEYLVEEIGVDIDVKDGLGMITIGDVSFGVDSTVLLLNCLNLVLFSFIPVLGFRTTWNWKLMLFVHV